MGGPKFHHATQNGMHFKTYNLFISRIFHLVFQDCGSPWITETMENETADNGGPLNVLG